MMADRRASMNRWSLNDVLDVSGGPANKVATRCGNHSFCGRTRVMAHRYQRHEILLITVATRAC